MKKIAEKKNNLLVELKTQAEESAKQKLKTRNAEILADKIYLENVMQQEEEKRNAEKLKKFVCNHNRKLKKHKKMK